MGIVSNVQQKKKALKTRHGQDKGSDIIHPRVIQSFLFFVFFFFLLLFSPFSFWLSKFLSPFFHPPLYYPAISLSLSLSLPRHFAPNIIWYCTCIYVTAPGLNQSTDILLAEQSGKAGTEPAGHKHKHEHKHKHPRDWWMDGWINGRISRFHLVSLTGFSLDCFQFISLFEFRFQFALFFLRTHIPHLDAQHVELGAFVG